MSYPSSNQSAESRLRAGFTLIEMIIGVTILAVLAKMMISATGSVGGLTETGNLEAKLMRYGDSAIQAIVKDLKMSGFQEIDGRDYPYVFDDGLATGDFSDLAYVPSEGDADPGDLDYGVHRSIALCLPSDLDGNGRPEMDADGNGVPELDGNGDGIPTDESADVNGLWSYSPNAEIHADTRLVWSHDDVTYAVMDGPTGEHELLRLVNGGADGSKVVARSVERLVFDTPASSGAVVPLGSVRVRIYFRAYDAEGHVVRAMREATVRLRNS